MGVWTSVAALELTVRPLSRLLLVLLLNTLKLFLASTLLGLPFDWKAAKALISPSVQLLLK